MFYVLYFALANIYKKVKNKTISKIFKEYGDFISKTVKETMKNLWEKHEHF